MAKAEKFLHEHFANLSDGDDQMAEASIQTIPDGADSITTSLDPPFAKVNTVAPNSPAERAGLKPGDEIRNFGYVNQRNNDGLKKVAECVQGNEGVCTLPAYMTMSLLMRLTQQNIFIKVSRPDGVANHQELRLTLLPSKDWGGRGMLGCHILPI